MSSVLSGLAYAASAVLYTACSVNYFSRVGLRCRAHFLGTIIVENALLELAYSVKQASRVSL